MKLKFLGAARCVTGSCHMIETDKNKILIDCGMRQGSDADGKIKDGEFPFDPAQIDAMLLTHAHIDHSGLIPLLVKKGFKGRIISTTATADLCTIMLPDSGHIKESDAEYQNRKLARQGKEPIDPLYTLEDAQESLKHFSPCEYGDIVTVVPGIRVQFTDAGHMLGSSSIDIIVQEQEKSTQILFSGDLGHSERPLVRDPQVVIQCDYLVLEGTYGDRIHRDEGDKVELLARVISDTFKRGGNVVIPSFAVGRTQEVLYYISKIIRENRLPQIKEIPVYIDSPLGIEATKIYERNAVRYYDDEAQALLKKGIDPLLFDSLRVAKTVDESKLINEDKEPKIIISSSGMCEAGRIRHHLKHNLWRRESTVLFVGYQAVGTLGRTLLDGKKKIKLFGEEINVAAQLVRFEGFSGHADVNELTDWAKSIKIGPKGVFLVHGEPEVLDSFAAKLRRELNVPIEIPEYLGEYDLAKVTGEVREFSQVAEQKPFIPSYHTDITALLEQSDRIYHLLKRIEQANKSLGDAGELKLKLLEVDLSAFADKWEKMLK